jgi:hypothetical protein
MRRRPFGAQAGLLAIVPLAGLGLALVSVGRAPRRLALLCNGVPLLGRVLERRESGSLGWMKITTLRVSYAVALPGKASAYRGAAGIEERTISLETTAADAPGAGAEIPLVADPRRPDRVAALLALPGALAVEPDGRIASCASAGLAICLALAAVAAQGLTAWLVLAS